METSVVRLQTGEVTIENCLEVLFKKKNKTKA